MPIPDYQTVMLPLLKLASDNKPHNTKDTMAALSMHFGLTQEDLNERIPSGKSKMYDRFAWAKTYLKEAALLSYPVRGAFQITDSGKRVLAKNPSKIDLVLLKQFPKFVQFLGGKETEEENADSGDASLADTSISNVTPLELYESACQQLRQQVEADLLSSVRGCTPQFFEGLVLELLRSMGYGGSVQDAVKRTGKAGDGGIDGIIKEDALGLSLVFVQAKRYTSASVGRPEVQGFVGALHGSDKGVFITASTFTKDAIDFAKHKVSPKRVILIDGRELVRLMYDHNVGVVKANPSYVIKTVNSGFFDEEAGPLGSE